MGKFTSPMEWHGEVYVTPQDGDRAVYVTPGVVWGSSLLSWRGLAELTEFMCNSVTLICNGPRSSIER